LPRLIAKKEMQAGSKTPCFHPSYISSISSQPFAVIQSLAAAKEKIITATKQRGSKASSHSTESAGTFGKVLRGNVLATPQGRKITPCCTCFSPSPADANTHIQSWKERGRFKEN